SGLALRVLDVEEIDVADLANEALRIGGLHVDLVHALEPGGDVEAVGARRRVAGQALVALTVVALDDETGIRVDHVEIADVVAIALELVFPGSPGESTLSGVEFEDPQVLSATPLLPGSRLLVPQRPFEERIEVAAVRRSRHALVAARAPNGETHGPRGGRRRHREVIRRLEYAPVVRGLPECRHLAQTIGLDNVGTELVAEVERVADELHRLDVEVRSGQVSARRRFGDDVKRDDLVRIVQEDGLEELDP